MTSISLAEYHKQYGGGRKTAVKSKRKSRGAKVESIGESLLATQLKALKIAFEQEFKFHQKKEMESRLPPSRKNDFGRGGRWDLEWWSAYKR